MVHAEGIQEAAEIYQGIRIRAFSRHLAKATEKRFQSFGYKKEEKFSLIA
jgi:hypothetical protein